MGEGTGGAPTPGGKEGGAAGIVMGIPTLGAVPAGRPIEGGGIGAPGAGGGLKPSGGATLGLGGRAGAVGTVGAGRALISSTSSVFSMGIFLLHPRAPVTRLRIIRLKNKSLILIG